MSRRVRRRGVPRTRCGGHVRRTVTAAALGATLLAPVGASSQASPREDPLDPVYVDLAKLRGFGLLPEHLAAQRPHSRREIARLIQAAEVEVRRGSLGERPRAAAERILERLRLRFASDAAALQDRHKHGALPLVEAVSMDLSVTDSESRPIPDNGLGGIDAAVDPLLQNRLGRRLVGGANLGVEATLGSSPSRWTSLSATPRAQISRGRGGSPGRGEVSLQNLQVNFLFGNVLLAGGRQHEIWGPSPDGGLVLSTNPRGLDMVRLGNDAPFRWPGFLRVLGPSSVTLFVARLEEDRHVPHSRLVGYRIGSRPWSGVELGMAVLVHSGGEGSPPASLGRVLADHLLFLDPFLDGRPASNRVASVDGRFTLSRATGAEFYVEYAVDDPSRRLKKLLWDDAGWIVGLWLPRLDDEGRWDARAEFRHTGLRFYRHSEFRSGLTVDGRIVGDALGPDGHAARLGLGITPGVDHRLDLDIEVERRSRDRYVGVPGPVLIHGFERVESFPKEHRRRIGLTWISRSHDGRVSVRGRLGLERVQDAAFVSGDDRTQALFEVGIQVRHVRSRRGVPARSPASDEWRPPP